ncbi:MAG: DinB family protein [Candidatus Zixiibacteriota bacterium]
MPFDLDKSLPILERTPYVVDAMLRGLPEQSIRATEGPNTWSPFDIVGHLIHGEKTNWIPRLEMILAEDGPHHFAPFDRTAMFKDSEGKSLDDLVEEFISLRASNVGRLKSADLTGSDFQKTGIHPEFGEVTLAQLLSAWTAHDLDHISQIARVLAKQHYDAVGPWAAYLRILRT